MSVRPLELWIMRKRARWQFARAYNGESWVEILNISSVHPLQKYLPKSNTTNPFCASTSSQFNQKTSTTLFCAQ